MNKETTYWKELRLISSEKARKCGIPAEGPVFVSPFQDQLEAYFCGRNFTPLIYQTGMEIQANHFHPTHEIGGIYYYQGVVLDGEELRAAGKYFRSRLGWIALLQPIGKIRFLNGVLISEAVSVEEIIAYCVFHYECQNRNRLSEGVILEHSLGEVVPVCSYNDHPHRGTPTFNFRVSEGRGVLVISISIWRVE